MRPGTDPAPTTPPGFWHCRALDADGRPLWFAVVRSDAHADAERVDLPEPEALAAVGDDAFCVARFGVRGEVTGLSVMALGAPKAPPLWFVELAEPAATPPAISLVAFSGHGVDPGRLLDLTALSDVAVRTEDQLGATRWYPATGEVDQVYVQPARRRQSIGTALMVAAGTLTVVRGGPRIWGDGQRTAMGDRWRNASPWASWGAELTHLAPPMTPIDQR